MQAGPTSGHRGRATARPQLALSFALAALAALLAAPPAAAQAPISLQFDNARPGTYFWANGQPMEYRFETAGQAERDVRVEAIHVQTGSMRKAWRMNAVPAQTRVGVRWRGLLKNGNPAPQGRYRFRVRELGAAGIATRERPNHVRLVQKRQHRFPVRGEVSWGDSWGAGRGHRGQDLFAPCGRAILAARAGRVVWRDFQAGGAGHYVVIRGRKDDFDYVYMHLRPNVLVRQGDQVRTGQRIGSNGASGNASGCHLHFELWRGHWFAGGRPLPAVTDHLRRWHRWG